MAIDSIVAIPYEEWTYDYIQPRPICIKKDNQCLQSPFTTPSESKKYQFELESESQSDERKIVGISNVTYVNLDSNDPEIQINAKVSEPNYYVFVLQYYQPDYPGKINQNHVCGGRVVIIS